jgi:hypothetical protein
MSCTYNRSAVSVGPSRPQCPALDCASRSVGGQQDLPGDGQLRLPSDGQFATESEEALGQPERQGLLMADMAVLFTHVVASNTLIGAPKPSTSAYDRTAHLTTTGPKACLVVTTSSACEGAPVTGRGKHCEPVSGIFTHWQPHLPGSESLAPHVSGDNEDKGHRLVREPARHFTARPRTWGLARTEWM